MYPSGKLVLRPRRNDRRQQRLTVIIALAWSVPIIAIVAVAAGPIGGLVAMLFVQLPDMCDTAELSLLRTRSLSEACSYVGAGNCPRSKR